MKRRITTASLLLALASALVWVTSSLGARAHKPGHDTHATDVNLTRVTTTLLEHSEFSHHPLDKELAEQWLDNYLNALDVRHSLFLQSDLDEFAHYRSALMQAIRGKGDSCVAL